MNTPFYNDNSLSSEIESSLTSEVLDLLNCHIEGNITPLEWYSTIKLSDGKPDVISITILSDVVYWYRPKILRDENSGKIIGYRKKFKEDILQRGYKEIESLFGFSKKQIREALTRLEKIGALKREFRNIQIRGALLTNVMYLRIFPSVIKSLTEKNMSGKINNANKDLISQTSETYTLEKERVVTSKELPPSLKGKRSIPTGKLPLTSRARHPVHQVNTYTKNSTENSIESISLERELLKMKDMWEERLKFSGSVTITKLRQKKLLQVFEEVFLNKFENWEKYVDIISKSDFLTGKVKDFRVSFDWAINPNNALKVLEGAYTNTSPSKAGVKVATAELGEARSYINSLENPLWKKINEMLLEQDYYTYTHWIQKLKFHELKNQTIYLEAGNSFVRDYVQTNYLRDIKRCIVEITQKNDISLKLIVKESRLKEPRSFEN